MNATFAAVLSFCRESLLQDMLGACRKVLAETDCLLYKWNIDAVEKMAGQDCIALAAAWRNLVLYSVGAAFSATCGDVSKAVSDSILQFNHLAAHLPHSHLAALPLLICLGS